MRLLYLILVWVFGRLVLLGVARRPSACLRRIFLLVLQGARDLAGRGASAAGEAARHKADGGPADHGFAGRRVAFAAHTPPDSSTVDTGCRPPGGPGPERPPLCQRRCRASLSGRLVAAWPVRVLAITPHSLRFRESLPRERTRWLWHSNRRLPITVPGRSVHRLTVYPAALDMRT
jgi:hypothetical protein